MKDQFSSLIMKDLKGNLKEVEMREQKDKHNRIAKYVAGTI